MIDLEQFKGHTPGPWFLDEPADELDSFKILYGTRLNGMPGENGYNGYCRAVHEEIEIGHCIWPCEDECGDCHDCRDFAEIEANARLIAAAPDLLAEVARLRQTIAAVEAVAQRLENEPLDWRKRPEWFNGADYTECRNGQDMTWNTDSENGADQALTYAVRLLRSALARETEDEEEEEGEGRE